MFVCQKCGPGVGHMRSMPVVVRDEIQVLGRLIMESRFGVYSKNRKKPQEFTAFFKKVSFRNQGIYSTVEIPFETNGEMGAFINNLLDLHHSIN